MSYQTDQIAAEAEGKLEYEFALSPQSPHRQHNKSVILTAIEKATEEKQRILDKYIAAMDGLYNHNEATRHAVVSYFGTLHPKGAFRAAQGGEQGAWTEETVMRIYVNSGGEPSGFDKGFKAISEAHNASLSQRPTPATVS